MPTISRREVLAGQFGLGLLLGAVWSPCVGPTLGAASVLAAKGENLPQVALTMLAFGVGAALPLLLLGILLRRALMRWRSRLLEGGKAGKTALGLILSLSGFSSRPASTSVWRRSWLKPHLNR